MNYYNYEQLAVGVTESFQVTVTEEMLSKFGSITGDFNPLHTDAEFAKQKGYKGKVCTVDAKTISVDALGKYFPNTPMLGAVVMVSKVVDPEEFRVDMVESFKHKFAKKPEVVEGNIKALERSMKEVQGL